jgi:cytochrome c553
MTKKTLISLTIALMPLVAIAQGSAIKGDAKAGEGKISACIGCHAIGGYKASFPSVYSVPMISGQTQAYLAAALTAYRKGDRSHPTMRAIAGSLSDQDIADLAAYYAGR